MSTSTAQLVALSLDAVVPEQLARFWTQALRWNMSDAGGDRAELVPNDATSFRLLLRPAATRRSARTGSTFDLTTTSLDDQEDSVAELLATGATHTDVGQGPDETHEETAIQAPDGTGPKITWSGPPLMPTPRWRQ